MLEFAAMNRFTDIADKVADGTRLSSDDALFLLQYPDLPAIGRLADSVRQRWHAGNEVTYIVDRNINYTNVCVTLCKFCAFYRRPGHEEGYDLPLATIYDKIRETKELGGVQILLQGGHHPDYDVERYEQLFQGIKANAPIHIHGLSPSEILHCCKVSKLPLSEVLKRMRAAGLDSIPGGGGEILVDRVRKAISPLKTMSDEWLGVMEEAHKQGLRTTATMMFGHVETLEERVEHMRRVREVQDRTAGFTAFISWTFQAPHTEMETTPMVGGFDYLRTAAVSRLFIDNIENFQASFVTQGIDLAGLSLRYGMNDLGSVMIEENVVSAANCECLAQISELEKQIRAAGFTPARRNMFYDRVDETGAPLRRHHDLAWSQKHGAGDVRPPELEAAFAGAGVG
ncbi:MAG: cyclic dehypoxanthine futalosine synthase [Planctomycetota bacterium]|nr:MAG: cyclic dehypoxanthine futalosine synthase [Planctomycetota bacterium]